MPIATFANAESGASIREKLNEAIEGVNALVSGGIDLPDLEVQYEGVWSFATSFPVVPPAKLHIMPLNESVGANGAWVPDLYMEEDHGDGPRAITNLTFVNLGGVYQSFYIEYFEFMATLICDELKVIGESFGLYYMPALLTVAFPSLEVIGRDFELYETGLFQTEGTCFGNIRYIGDDLFLGYNNQLVHGRFDNLETIGGELYVYGNASMVLLDLPSLKYIGDSIYLYQHESLEALNLPAIERLGYISLEWQMDTLHTIVIGETLREAHGDVYISGPPLTEESVDNLLIRYAALDGTNGTVAYADRSITINEPASPPSSAGLAAIAVLEGRNVSVSVPVGD